MNSSSAPSLLAVLAAALIAPGAFAAEKGLPAGARVLRDLPYVTGGHVRQRLDLYLPEKPAGPLLVYIHGGGWQQGSKDRVAGLQLLDQGFAVASLAYRFSQDAVFPAQIEDCKAAVRWLRAHAADYGYRTGSVAALGLSAGGHLTALLATTGQTRDFDVGENLDQSSAIQCAIDWFGPTDFAALLPPAAEAVLRPESPGSMITRLFGGPLSQKGDLARRASPVTWVTKDSAPIYIMHGTGDRLVPVAQSRILAEKYQTTGAPVTLEILEGAGHGGPEFMAPERAFRQAAFLQAHLKPE